MNNLSWFLYLADVFSGIGWILGTIFVLACIITVLTLLSVVLSDGQVLDKDIRPKWLKVLWSAITAAVLSGLIGAAVPSRDTMYAIAASEMGEDILRSETGTKATQALNAWLDRQINSQQPAAE